MVVEGNLPAEEEEVITAGDEERDEVRGNVKEAGAMGGVNVKPEVLAVVADVADVVEVAEVAEVADVVDVAVVVGCSKSIY